MQTSTYTTSCFSKEDCYTSRLDAFCHALREADHVLIGAGAGLSAAAGLEYAGKRFTANFQDFIGRYGIRNMYEATFYPFETEEERWAYLARHVRMNRLDNDEACGLYRALLRLVEGKDYFVITTNVDGLFKKSGFAAERVFEVQGDYAYMQCGVACHDNLYFNGDLVRQMTEATHDCRIPSSLVPRCPKCGGRMELHIRKDGYFIENDEWQESLGRYSSFCDKAQSGRTLLIELGVGFNTPTIIRFPFEQMASAASNVTLVRMNSGCADRIMGIRSFVPFTEGIGGILGDAACVLGGGAS